MKAPPNDAKKEAYCKVCSAYLAAQHKNLLEHSKTEKHKSAIKRDKDIVNIPKIDKFTKLTLTVSRKTAELILAFFIAHRTSIKTIDDLLPVIKKIDRESQIIKAMQIHRTNVLH